jgi:hypothetical protein
MAESTEIEDCAANRGEKCGSRTSTCSSQSQSRPITSRRRASWCGASAMTSRSRVIATDRCERVIDGLVHEAARSRPITLGSSSPRLSALSATTSRSTSSRTPSSRDRGRGVYTREVIPLPCGVVVRPRTRYDRYWVPPRITQHERGGPPAAASVPQRTPCLARKSSLHAIVPVADHRATGPQEFAMAASPSSPSSSPPGTSYPTAGA